MKNLVNAGLLRAVFLCACIVSVPTSSLASVIAHARDIGITPESLAVAGLEPADAEAILGRIVDATTIRQSIVAAVAAVDALVHEVGSLRTAVQLDDDLLAQLVTAEEAMDAALVSLQSERELLLAAALDGVATPAATLLAIWRSCPSRVADFAFRAVSRTVEEWMAIEFALRVERRAARLGDAVPTEHGELLAAVRGEAQVIEAQYRITMNLHDIKDVFAGFASP